MTEPVPHSGEMTYNGTAESRLRITNWNREILEDPGEPLTVTLQPGFTKAMDVGDTLTRNPNGTYSIQEMATEPEG